MSKEAIKKYLSDIGAKGGKAGSGKSKLRGGTNYYKRISKLAAEARKARQKEPATTNTTKRGNK